MWRFLAVLKSFGGSGAKVVLAALAAGAGFDAAISGMTRINCARRAGWVAAARLNHVRFLRRYARDCPVDRRQAGGAAGAERTPAPVDHAADPAGVRGGSRVSPVRAHAGVGG